MANPSDKVLPQQDADLGGDYARDTHRGGLGDDYARESEIPKTDEERRAKDQDAGVGKASE